MILYFRGWCYLFAQRLKELRIYRQLTQSELAHKINTTKSTISNYENGYSSPSLDIIVILAKTLQTTTDYLLGHIDFNEQLYEKCSNSRIYQYWIDELNTCGPQDLIHLKKIWELMKNFKYYEDER